ncbi:MAG TPA: formylglycine-generating enzyme family protein [Rhodanobacteraceae bacterium]|nr:formylglycine-generating enzyme family protein [Rhodanobacteraceae bacterium]
MRRATLALAIALAAIAGADAAEYVAIPGGTFTSVLPADDKAADAVVAPFELRATPVTNAEFVDFVQGHPEWRRDRVAEVFAESRYLSQWPEADALGDGMAQQPVTAVSWFAAAAFCESENARLPSWYEWEFAAAADPTRTDARDDPAWRERILAWYARPSTAPLAAVGGEANVYGVRDLHGLVWEWVDDFNALLVSGDNRDQGDPDKLRFCGAGAISMQQRENYAVLMRIAMLSSLKASDTTANLGFRCARSVKGTRP